MILRSTERRERDRGQAAVEFALALPLVVILVLGVLHVVLVVRDLLGVELAARAGARAAAAAASPGAAAERAAFAATAIRPLEVVTSVSGDRVTVVVRHRSDPAVPIIGTFVPAVELRAAVTMAREPP